MYENYFGLLERPFSIAPDPQYLYLSTRHKEAMAHLSYGLTQGGGFIVLTGEVGTGKTTLCRNLLDDLPENIDVALILNPNINELELLQTLCDELGITYERETSQKELLGLINQHLLQAFADNRNTVLIIDEAQLLSRDVLEQIRLLTNLETNKSKLLQIILIGQPELNDLLSRNDLRQLSQRITARYHLDALKRTEMQDYVNHRLGVAGCKEPLFSKQALSKLHALSQGIPRKINVLADHALLAAYSKSVNMVDAKTVDQAGKEVFVTATNRLQPMRNRKWVLLFLIALIGNLMLMWHILSGRSADKTAANMEQSIVGFSDGETLVDDGSNKEADSPAVPSVKENNEALSADSDVTATKNIENAEQNEQAPEQADQNASSKQTDAFEQELSVPNSDNELKLSGKPQPHDLEAMQQVTNAEELASVLATAADQTSRINAFRALADIWSKPLPSVLLDNTCNEIAKLELQCQSFSSWNTLIKLNRPAILVLQHEEQLHRVLLTQLNDQVAKITVGEQVLQVPEKLLQQAWVGKGLLFWQPPEIGAGIYQQGDAGPGVIWLRLQLNKVLEYANLPSLESTVNPEFDSKMQQRVADLQAKFGLPQDGVIGQQTLVLMNEALNERSTPMLFSRRIINENMVDGVK